jgi:hypothetical protein
MSRGDNSLDKLRGRAVRLMGGLLVKARVLRSRGTIPDPHTIYWLDPKRIGRFTRCRTDPGGQHERHDQNFPVASSRARVCDGDWDRGGGIFEEGTIYKAFEQRIRHGYEWQDTEYFRRMLAWIAAGEAPRGCRSEADIRERCHYLDSLIESVRSRGYLVTSAGASPDGRHTPEMTVNISRDGEYVFNSGRHRLSIAKVLGLPRVAVQVLVRHTQWQALRESLFALARAHPAGLLPEPPLHPDLVDLPAARDCEEQFERLRSQLPPQPGSLLEVGARLAYFCHRFEDLGYSCQALGVDPRYAAAAERIRSAEGRSFSVTTIPLEAWDSAPFFLSVGPRVVIFHEPPGTEGARRLQRKLVDASFTALPLTAGGSALAYVNFIPKGASLPYALADGGRAELAPRP